MQIVENSPASNTFEALISKTDQWKAKWNSSQRFPEVGCRSENESAKKWWVIGICCCALLKLRASPAEMWHSLETKELAVEQACPVSCEDERLFLNLAYFRGQLNLIACDLSGRRWHLRPSDCIEVSVLLDEGRIWVDSVDAWTRHSGMKSFTSFWWTFQSKQRSEVKCCSEMWDQ